MPSGSVRRGESSTHFQPQRLRVAVDLPSSTVGAGWPCRKKCFLQNEPKVVQCLPGNLKKCKANLKPISSVLRSTGPPKPWRRGISGGGTPKRLSVLSARPERGSASRSNAYNPKRMHLILTTDRMNATILSVWSLEFPIGPAQPVLWCLDVGAWSFFPPILRTFLSPSILLIFAEMQVGVIY
jgi:hypothetical protein